MCGIAMCDSPDCTWREKHRAMCEARYVLSLPLERRKVFLQNVEKIRGKDAADYLKNNIMTVWNAQKSEAQNG